MAALLTVLLRPLLSRIDLYKTLLLVVIAFAATLPWDAYLVHRGIWTYPAGAIVGPRLLGVPAEELFFFVVQTYITSLVYVLLNGAVLHAQHLTNGRDAAHARTAGQALLAAGTAAGAWLVARGGPGTYLGLILAWACPFALLTWSLAGCFALRVPRAGVVGAVLLPTAYLWVVDELALDRGTWAIASGTKLGWCLWGRLEVEEAVFFLATNVLIVLGLVAFDQAAAALDAFPDLFPHDAAPVVPPPALLLRAALTDPARYDIARVRGLRAAVATLRRKSRSFYLASSVFPGRLRINLILL